MGKYGLCGEKLSHSYSEMIHKLLGNNKYCLLSMSKDEFYKFMHDKNFSAVNVTIPFKTDALKLCDIVSPEASEIGSVNTVVNKKGVLYGYNTDIHGFIYMIDRAGISVKGKNVMILGTGGTSLTANAACRHLCARKIITVSRSGKINYENVYENSDIQIIINTTPVGMYPNNGTSPVDISRFPHLEGVADVIYNPKRTRLLLDAQKYGIKTAGGLSMLVSQAVEADRLFFERDISDDDREKTEKILSSLSSYVRNIVLVGMPGCGKSTVGKIIAEKTNRKFIDSDDYITEKIGRTPENIILKDGEQAFRDIETSALEDITKLSCSIISCGGGAVLKEYNRELIRQNSTCIYLTRDIEHLATNGRPLSSGGIEKLKEIFSVRDSLYSMTADFSVPFGENASACAENIIERCCKSK